jgi:hypothetical protein
MLESILSKKIVNMFCKTIQTATKKVQHEILILLIKIMKIPNYDLRMIINDFILKSLIQSKSAYHRLLFLELAVMAIDEFSSDYFTKNFSHLLFLYQKEKCSQVALQFSLNVCKYREGIGSHNTIEYLAPGSTLQK